MENLNSDDIELLKSSIENKFGRRILYAKDCGELSQNVFEKTGCKVSETTLKRLWKLVNSAFNPSKYTLNSLANYLDYKDFNDFSLHRDDYKKNAENLLIWTQLRETALKISQNSATYLKSRMGISFDKAIKRSFYPALLKEFLDSEKDAFALVAPEGFGKTVAVLQSVDEFLENSKNSDDILWYFNCSPDNPHNALNDSLKDVLSTFLGLGGKMSYKECFEKKPAALNGRLILVLDGVCTGEILDSILNITAAYKNEKYFKTILTLNPTVWKTICGLVMEDNKDCWFNADWNPDSSSFSNVPYFSYDEAIQILKNCDRLNVVNFEYLVTSEIKDIFRTPGCIELLVTLKKNNITKIDIFNRFSELHSGGYKFKRLVDFFLFTTNYGFDATSTDKKRLAKILEEYKEEFDTLLSYGILTEKDSTDSAGIKHTDVKFSSHDFFEYHLANYWRGEFGISESLFYEVSSYYGENPEMQTGLFEWFIRYAFYEQNIPVLKKAFKIIDDRIKDKEKNLWLKRFYCYQIKFYPGLYDKVLTTESERTFYLKEYGDLDFASGFLPEFLNRYLEKEKSDGKRLLALSFKMLNSFLKCCGDETESLYSEIKKLEIKVENGFQYMLLLSCKLLYDYTVYGSVESGFLSHVLEFSSEYYTGKKSFSRTEYMLTDVLVLTECYETAKSLAEKIPELNPVHKLQYSFVLFKLKNYQKARRIYEENIKTVFESLPHNSFYYVMLKCCRISLSFTQNDIFKKAGEYFSRLTGTEYYSKIFSRTPPYCTW